MDDIMIDLETFGARSDALIVQIGACFFDRTTGEIGKTFFANVDPSFRSRAFSVDYATIKWWLSQSEQARASLMMETKELKSVLESLYEFLDKRDANIWCHATFDMPILLHAFEVVGMKFPIHYRNMRDIRTLMDLADHHSDTKRTGVHHNALDDAKFQAQYCTEAMQKLK